MSVGKFLVRGGLVLALGALGVYQYQSLKKPLAPQLVSVEDVTRNLALAKLPKLSPQSKSVVVTALVTYQSDPDPKTRRFALYALRQMGETQPAVISMAVKLATDENAAVREEALAVLYRMGEAAIANLIDVLRTEEGASVEMAQKVLQKLEGKVVPALTAFINETPSKGQLEAVRILRRMGNSAKEATPLLVGLLDSKELPLRLEAALALDGMGLLNKTSAPQLSRDLMEGKESYSNPLAPRPQLVLLLEKLDPRRRDLVDLTFDIKQKNPVVRYRAAHIISEMNPPNIGTMEIMVDALADSDVYVAARALAALSRMGLEKTERIAKKANPRIKSALARVQEAKIEGFDPIEGDVLKFLQ